MVANVVGQILIGWLLADFLGGVFHWWQDRLTDEKWPVIGPWLIEPSRLHHRSPLYFLQGSFAYRNRANALFVLAIGAAWYALFGMSVALVAAVIGGMVSTQAHYWAHTPHSAGPLVRVLQEVGVIQSPKHHAGHHRPPQTARYCPLTDWLNPVLDNLDLWGRAERLLQRVAKPA